MYCFELVRRRFRQLIAGMSGLCNCIRVGHSDWERSQIGRQTYATSTHKQTYGNVQELKVLRRAGVRTFAEADAYEVEHRRRRAPASLRPR